MKHLFSIFAAVICLGTLPLAAVTGDQLRQALDLPGSIKVSAPGQYMGSTAAWSIAGDGAVPATPVGKQCIYDGSVRSEGGSCVVGNVPPRNGYEGHLNLRSRNFFTVSVKGTGSFKFRYRTSVAYAQDAALLIYEYDGNNSAKLNVDEYDNPYGTIPLPVDESYEEHFWEGEAWPVYEGEETWSPDPGGISAPTFWKEKEIFLDNSRYTHQLVFAALGPAMYDGTEGNLITGEELLYEGEVKEDKIYLDNFRWIPDSDEYAPRVLVFSKPDGTVFANKMLLTLSTEYDEKVFRFYYTTDGTEPTVRSKEYIIYDPNGENADTDVNDDMNYGIHLNADTTVKVLVTERLSGETVGTYKASYTHKNLDGPSVNVTPENNFSDTTAIEFVGNYQGYSSWAFYHTLDGTEPTEESISGGIFTYKNSELDGKTLKVIAVVNETLISETVSIRLERLQPRITWELDGAAASADDFVFASSAKVAPPADGVRYAMQPASGEITASGTIKVVAVSSGKLASQVVERTFRKVDTPLPVTAEAIRGEAENGGWVLYALPGYLGREDAAVMAQWLKAFELNTAGGAWKRATSLQYGVPYFVNLAAVDFNRPPEGILYAAGDGSGAGSESAKWQLSVKDAQIIWKNGAYVPAGDASALPGWIKK